MFQKLKKAWNKAKRKDGLRPVIVNERPISQLEAYHFDNSPIMRQAVARFRDKNLLNI